MTDDTPFEQTDPSLQARLTDVRQRVDAACDRAGRRGDDMTIVAVSKHHPAAAIRLLYDQGQRHFGESYVQEWQDKAAELPEDIVWHFVGHLQSNKAKYVADQVAMVHSVDRRSVTKQLSRRSERPVDVLLQVNIAGQETKSGVAPNAVIDLLEMTREYPRVRPRGLMALPPHVDEADHNRSYFRRMRRLLDNARQWLAERAPATTDAFEHLSMGMTADFEVAIEEGATIVRIGTAIFGPRNDDP